MLKVTLCKICLLILIILTCAQANAQQEMQYTVYLKSGRVIKGIIISMEPAKSIKIETADKNVVMFQMSEVDRLEKDTPAEGTSDNHESENIMGYVDLSGGILNTQSYTELPPNLQLDSIRTNASRDKIDSTLIKRNYEFYQGNLFFGYGNRQNTNNSNVVKIDLINSYRFNEYFSCGIGLGIRNYTDYVGALFPVYADMQLYLPHQSNLYPYIGFGAGYSAPSDEYFVDGGVILKSSVGLSIHVKNYTCINLALEYESQKTVVLSDKTNDLKLETIGIILGLSF